MMVEMSDPDASLHIVKDIYGPTDPSWRWTSQNPTVQLLVLSTENLKFIADFAIWDDGFKVTGPLEIAYLVNGKLLDKIRYTTPGVKHFEKPVPADWLAADSDTTVGMSVDKLYVDPKRRRKVWCDPGAHGIQTMTGAGNMLRVIPVLFGALFTIATAWSLGMLLFRKLSLVFHAWEERLLAFVAGSACLSAIMFVLSATRLVRRGILLVLGLAIIGYAAYSGSASHHRKTVPAAPAIVALGLRSGLRRLHLHRIFQRVWRPSTARTAWPITWVKSSSISSAHGFLRITTDIYSNLSQGVELAYLFAFDFGRHSAASLVHFTFLVVLAFLILSYGRRIGRPEVGVAAALFTYACPIVLLDASIAYIDVALAAVLFALFYLLQIWDENRDPKMLVPIGLLAGFGYEVKYTAILAVPYAVGFVAWKLWRAAETGAAAGAGGLAHRGLLHRAVDGEELDRSGQSGLAAR